MQSLNTKNLSTLAVPAVKRILEMKKLSMRVRMMLLLGLVNDGDDYADAAFRMGMKPSDFQRSIESLKKDGWAKEHEYCYTTWVPTPKFLRLKADAVNDQKKENL